MNKAWTKGKKPTPPGEAHTILCDASELPLVLAKLRRSGLHHSEPVLEPDGRTGEVLPSGLVVFHGEAKKRRWCVRVFGGGADSKPEEGESVYRFNSFSQGMRGHIGLVW
jgi:hypothetical protein